MFSNFTETHYIPQGATACDFGNPGHPGINVEETTESNDQRFGFYLVNTLTGLITASLAISIEGVSLLYVASNGTIELVGFLSCTLCSFSPP